MKKLCRLSAASVVLFGSFTINLAAFAQVQQVLDSVVVTGDDFSIVSSDGITFTQQFPSNDAAAFIDCEATSDGTFCLDGPSDIVKLSEYPGTLFTCEEAGFEAKGNRPAQCSAIAVEDESTLHIAGILNRNGSAIVTCVKDPNTGVYDCDPLVQDRPPIVDLDRVPDGLLYVENKNTVVLLMDNSPAAPTVVTLANGRDLGLAKGKDKEEIVRAAQIVNSNGAVQYVVTTSFGRMIAFNSTLGVVTGIKYVCLAGTCDASGQVSFDVAQNAERGGPIYALVSDTGSGTGIVYAYSNDLSAEIVLDSEVDPVETTADGMSFNGLFLSVFEGQNVNFTQCGDEPCPLGNAADLTFNHVAGTAETGTVWEIREIPHCAWHPNLCVAPLEESQPGFCALVSAMSDQDCMCKARVLRIVGEGELYGNDPVTTTCANAPPGLLDFNPVPILPGSLIAEFDEFPTEIWMPPFFEAQEILNRHFDALLIDPGDGQSGEAAELVVRADEKFGAYGCPGVDPNLSPLQSSAVLRMREGPLTGGTCNDVPNSGERICALDERMGSMITYDCSSTRSRGCCSLFPLDVMLARRPPALRTDGNVLRWYLDTDKGANPIEDDSAAAKFIDWHFEKLEVFEWAACAKDDNEPGDPDLAPLNETTCDQLAHIRNQAREKLSGAFENTANSGLQNNCSQASRLYGSFNSQINNYVTLAGFREDTFPLCNDGVNNDDDGEVPLIDGADPDCTPPIPRDRAGRIEALVAHASVLPYAVDRILLPTIPSVCDTGWLEDDDEWWQDLASP